MKIDIVMPVYNEEKALKKNITLLVDFLRQRVDHEWRIVIADSGSTDATPRLARELMDACGEISYLRAEKKGRGRVLRKAWLKSRADIVSYMDIDLSTDLGHFPELIEAIQSGQDIAVGTRLSKLSRVERSLLREILSRGFNRLIKLVLRTKSFSDAQCGFKALTKACCDTVAPWVKNDNWFFDTELLFLAERHNFKIREVPVKWIEDRDSRVNIGKAVLEDLLGILRLRFTRLGKQ